MYQASYDRFVTMFKQLEFDTAKICHLWRLLAARGLNDAGVARGSSCKHGHWKDASSSDALERHYLRGALVLVLFLFAPQLLTHLA